MSETTRPEVVDGIRRWVREVFNEHRVDRVETLKVADYVDWNPYPGQDVALNGFKGVLEEFLESFPDFRYDVDEELFEGDSVVCVGKWYGTMQNEFMGLPASGELITARRTDAVRFHGDKMTERWGVGNELRMLRFLGVIGTGPEVTAVETFEETARAYLDAVLGRFDLAALDALVDIDAVSDAAGSLVHLCVVGALDGYAVDVERLGIDGDTATAEVTVRGTFARPMWRTAPTGAEVALPLTVTLHGSGTTITSVTLAYDLEAMASALGAPEGEGVVEVTTPTGTTGDGKFVLRAFVNEVLNGRDVSAVGRLIAPEATDLHQETVTMAAFLHAFPDYRFSVERVIIDGDRASLLAAFAGTHRRALMGHDATGTAAITRSIDVFTVTDGRLSDIIYGFDMYSLLTRLEIFPEKGRYPGVAAG
ncbi:ester cyclase [Nocardiopsis sp. N85]|uniref:ester cyclase n=1 Tax=Nocardiopsis sp. N85 TaxID=3029400 RepID=UPI00237F6449|nr:ester cyclase [Nocardiopsis sp. N85]MDE3723230.1 ester cyclase [Nocardiopsis sp. N85]